MSFCGPNLRNPPPPDPSSALDAYLAEIKGHPLLTAEDERALALEIGRRRVEHWRALLGYYPLVGPICAVVVGQFGADPSEAEVELVAACRTATAAAEAVRDRDRKATRAALDRATDALAVRLAATDPECTLAAAVFADVRLLAERGEAKLLAVGHGSRSSGILAHCIQCAVAAKHALQHARHRFARANLRLVVRMAHGLRDRTLPLPDLIQEGNIGLLRAVDRFEPERGFRFSTYAAWWIRHYMTRAQTDKGRLVRVPVHLHDLARMARKARAVLRSESGVEPTLEAVAATIEKSPAQVRRAERAVASTAWSLDDPAPSVRYAVERLVGDDRPDMALAQAEALDVALAGLDGLRAQERWILERRMGLDGQEPRTLAEVGDECGLSRERIRQIQNGALAKLRRRIEVGS